MPKNVNVGVCIRQYQQIMKCTVLNYTVNNRYQDILLIFTKGITISAIRVKVTAYIRP